MTPPVSRRTILLLALGLAAIAGLIFAISAGIGGETGTLAISDFGELALVGGSAFFVLWVARSFRPGEPVRRQWLAIGLGMLSFAVGDAIWTYMEVIQGIEPPYPGLPDLFYLLEYPLVAFGLMSAGLAYRGLISLKKPAIISVVFVAVLGVALWFGLLAPHIVFTDIPVGEKVLSALYPLADLVLYLGPALFVALVVRSLGGGRLAWPWWAVVVGVTLLAFADTGYSLLSATDAYASGNAVDYGWSAGHLMIAVGASLLYDLAHPLARARVAPADAAASA